MALQPIVLKGEQKKVLFLPPTEPIQIKGVAGSGKTTVALYRAKHLIETQSNLFKEAKVVIFTYNRTLADYIKALRPHVSGGYQKDSDLMIKRSTPGLNVEIFNFHKWAYHFLKSHGYSMYNRTVNQDTQNSIIESIKKTIDSTSNILNKKNEFFTEEICWIKGKLFHDKKEYLEAKRIGRGIGDRVTAQDKEIIWQVYTKYIDELKRRSVFDFDDYAILVIKVIDEDNNFQPPFTHMIIDEAQDLNKAQIIALSKIVSSETKSISIIADAAQRIFKSGFTWSEVGINVRGGRTIEFKKNYRSTVPIVNAAISLLQNETDKEEFTTVETARAGSNKPVLGYFSDWEEQMAYLDEKVTELMESYGSIVVLHRKRGGVNQINSYLSSNGFDTEIIYDAVSYESSAIKICTLSSIKGLEFDVVFIVDCNDNVIPHPDGFSDENDEFHISTERRLLYTAMTRAKDRLFMFSSDTPTRYFLEINEKYIIKVGDSIPEVSDDDEDLPF